MRRALPLLMFTACASHPAPAPVAAPPPVAAPAPAPAAFGIAPLEIYFDDVMVMQMRADGTVMIRHGGTGPMVPSFTLAQDGTIASVDGPKGEITADGRLRSPRGRLSRFRLDGETLALGDRHLHLDASGVLQVDGPAIGGTPPRAAGVIDRASRRTALLLLGMFLDAAL